MPAVIKIDRAFEDTLPTIKLDKTFEDLDLPKVVKTAKTIGSEFLRPFKSETERTERALQVAPALAFPVFSAASYGLSKLPRISETKPIKTLIKKLPEEIKISPSVRIAKEITDKTFPLQTSMAKVGLFALGEKEPALEKPQENIKTLINATQKIGEYVIAGGVENIASKKILENSLKILGGKLTEAGYGVGKIIIPQLAIDKAGKYTPTLQAILNNLNTRIIKISPKPPAGYKAPIGTELTTKVMPRGASLLRPEARLPAKPLGISVEPIQPSGAIKGETFTIPGEEEQFFRKDLSKQIENEIVREYYKQRGLTPGEGFLTKPVITDPRRLLTFKDIPKSELPQFEKWLEGREPLQPRGKELEEIYKQPLHPAPKTGEQSVIKIDKTFEEVTTEPVKIPVKPSEVKPTIPAPTKPEIPPELQPLAEEIPEIKSRGIEGAIRHFEGWIKEAKETTIRLNKQLGEMSKNARGKQYLQDRIAYETHSTEYAQDKLNKIKEFQMGKVIEPEIKPIITSKSISQTISTPEVTVSQTPTKFYAKIALGKEWKIPTKFDPHPSAFKKMNSEKAIGIIKKSLKKITRQEGIIEGEQEYMVIEGEGGFASLDWLKPVEYSAELFTKTFSEAQKKFDAVKYVLKSPIGKSLIDDFEYINTKTATNAGKWLTPLNYFKDIKSSEYEILTDLLEGKQVTLKDPQRLEFLKGIAKNLRQATDDVYNLAQKLGVKEKVIDENGRTTWIPIRKVENYIPREIKPEIREKLNGGLKQLYAKIIELKNKGIKTPIKQALAEAEQEKGTYISRLIQFLKEKDIHTTPTNLLRLLNKLINREYISAYGHLERPRTAPPLPPEFYERRAPILFNKYFTNVAKRLAEIERFGQTNESLLSRLKWLEENLPEEGKIIRKLYNRYIDKEQHQLSSNIATAISIVKVGLGTSTIPNISQTLISTIPKQGVFTFLKGALNLAIKPKTKQLVKQTTLGDRRIINLLLGYEDNSILSRVNDKLTKINWFQGINRLNALLTCSSTETWINNILIPSTKSLLKIRKNWAIDNLKKLGIDLGDIINGKISDEKMIDAMYKTATNYQLFSNVLNEPLFLSNPNLRWATVLKRFGYKQPLFVIHEIIYDELKHANPFPLLKLIAGGLLGGAFTVWAYRKLRDLADYAVETVTGETPEKPEWYSRMDDEDRSIWEKALDLLSQAGTMGMISDMMRLDKEGKWSARQQIQWLASPVIISEAVKAGSIIDILLKGERKVGRRTIQISPEERFSKAGIKLLKTFPISKFFISEEKERKGRGRRY